MSATVAISIAVLALAGSVALLVKWLALRRLCRRLAGAASGGSARELQNLRSAKGYPEWVRSLAGTSLDALEERRALRVRVEERELFEALLNEIGHGFFIVNHDLEIQFANKAAKGLFPALRTGDRRRLIEVLMDHRLVDVVRKAVAKRKRRSAAVRIESPAGNDDERVDRVFEIEAAPLPVDPEAGCWVMMRDITERVVTEQVRKDFVANASHELRTPLTLINGYVETLADGLIDDREAAMKSLEIMGKHGKRIERIIEDMLTISKLESGGTPLRLEPFDVGQCVKDVVDHLAALVDSRRAVIELDFPQGDLSMVGDRFYWDQIFMNLIENALKQNQRPGLRVKVSFRTEGAGHLIAVCDDGVGIQRGDLQYIFKRFYRGARHHSQEIKGTGLGLSIVKRAVEAHGGTVSVESRPGVETVFRMTVPLLDCRPADEELPGLAMDRESLIAAATPGE